MNSKKNKETEPTLANPLLAEVYKELEAPSKPLAEEKPEELGIQGLPAKRRTLERAGSIVYWASDTISFRIKDSSNKSALKSPAGIRVTAQSEQNYQLDFLYLPKEAPRNGSSINLDLFNRLTVLIQTGVNSAGVPVGKTFKNLNVLGFFYKTFEEDELQRKYEVVACVTDIPSTWDKEPIDLLPKLSELLKSN